MSLMSQLVIPGEQIITITRGGILYTDLVGIRQWVDFVECRQQHLAQVEHATPLDRRYVGCRNTENSATIYVRFFCDPPVIFAFKSIARRNLDVIQPMSRLGWYTTVCIRSTEALPE